VALTFPHACERRFKWRRIGASQPGLTNPFH
jgi:hypothetical protein